MADSIRAAADIGAATGFYPLAPSVDDEVRSAVSEVRNLPSVPYPSMASVVANHPGVAGYQVMTDPEYQQAVKYDLLMRRLEAIRNDRGGMAYNDSEVAQAVEPEPEPRRDRSFWARRWGTEAPKGYEQTPPYRHRGILAQGQPVRIATDVMNIPFSAVANTAVRPFFNMDRAVEVQPKQLNKATGGLYNAFTGKDPNPEWSEEQRFVESIPFDSPAMMDGQGNPSVAYQRVQGLIDEARESAGLPPRETGYVEGSQILGDMGMAPGWKRDLLGMVVESPFDFFTSAYGPMARNAGRAARYASPAARNAAMRGVALEAGKEFVAPPAVLTGLMEAAKYAARSNGKD